MKPPIIDLENEDCEQYEQPVGTLELGKNGSGIGDRGHGGIASGSRSMRTL